MRPLALRALLVLMTAAWAAACGSTDGAARSTSAPLDGAAPGAAAPLPARDAGDVLDAGSDASPESCAPRDTDAPPKAASFPVTLAGQAAWIHDERSPAGYFHTFDALALGGGVEGAARKVHVFLPRSYPAGCKRYPVVYMNDGDTAFFAGAFGKSWDVQAVLTESYAAGLLPEVIVVAVHPLERDREYTHAPWLAGRACCDAPAYVAYLADALKPFVDGAYRTRRGPSDTVIAGSSHGGLAAFLTASTRPAVFGKAIAMSSSFWAGLDDRATSSIGGPLATSALMQAAGPGLLGARPRLYLDWGLVRTGGDFNAVIEERATARGREMRALLLGSYGYALGQSLLTVEDPLGEHEENSWHRRFGHALAVVLGP
jgi:hypothetical protein